MQIPKPHIANLIRKAVELRVAGLSWAQTGERLKRHQGSVQRWAHDYREYWDQLANQIREEIATEVGDEALAILRNQLRSNNEKIRQDSAKKLVDFRKAPAEGNECTSIAELYQFMQFLSSLSDDDLRTFLGDELAQFLPANQTGPDPDANSSGTA